MNRAQFQQIARLRLREADTLLRGKLFSGAYYLSGYAVECAKACFAKLIRRHEFPGKDFIRNACTHDFIQLIKTAQLGEQYRIDIGKNTQLAANWTIVKEWKEDGRYSVWRPAQARAMVEAINEQTDGVFPWIERHW